MEVVLGYVLGVASVLLILLVVRTRRTASPPQLSAVVRDGRESERDRTLAELVEVVTELGEEIAQLTFDPAAPDVRPESLADYRRALDSYGKAGDALDGRDLDRVRQQLACARNALVRLDARAHGLPVPIDVSRAARDRGRPIPYPFQTKRFSYSGSNERSYLIPIDWPEPGRAAITEVTRNGTGLTDFNSVLVPAEEAKPNTVGFHQLQGNGRARFHLATVPDSHHAPTHLQIVPSGLQPDTGSWTVRLHPLSEAVELLREYQGTGSEVLVHRSNAPAVLGIHIDTSRSWEVEYRCLRKHRRGERCMFSRLGTLIYGSSDASLRSARFCGHGLITVTAAQPARWSLTVTPERPTGSALSGLRQRLGI
ncbi:hypothetical protein [Peterkaempfera griseoplana]|uniref:hypothetical protein n=1 Tax=Peterkaempfera griseoplana TaxID=66896 RepID=UPI0006E449D9|nr:hypothetical protein [Peterkaempfera griseoplana]